MLHSIAHRFNTLLLVLIALMVASLIAIMASRAGAGPLDPPGTPGSTLPQVEPRMPIPPVGWNGAFPIVISQPGSYFLTRNLTGVSGANGIVVSASGVTIDLNGFALVGAALSANGILAGLVVDLNVRNGTVEGWGQVGISVENTSFGLYEELRLTGNAGGGIRAGGSSMIRNVVASNNGAHGILINATGYVIGGGGIIQDCTASSNTLDGIQVLGWVRVTNNLSYGNHGAGIHVIGQQNFIESNSVYGNTGGGVVADSFSAANVITHNAAQANLAGNYVDHSGTNDFGPTAVASTATSPWANISH